MPPATQDPSRPPPRRIPQRSLPLGTVGPILASLHRKAQTDALTIDDQVLIAAIVERSTSPWPRLPKAAIQPSPNDVRQYHVRIAGSSNALISIALKQVALSFDISNDTFIAQRQNIGTDAGITVFGRDFAVSFDASGFYLKPAQPANNAEADAGQSFKGYTGTGGRDRLISTLDQIKTAIDGDPALKAAFEAHALFQGSKGFTDPVAAEIAATVTDKWIDRKVKHKGEAWIKNPSTFVAHVYRKWIEAGTLKQVHLKHDMPLYRRYATHISLRHEDDLHLEKSPAGRPPQASPQ